jgi:hypothetical protein
LGLRELLAKDSRASSWEKAVVFSLALQMRSALLLLGLWRSHLAQGWPPFISSLRTMPAHPDWYLSALIQNLAIAGVFVWLTRRMASGWAIPITALAGAAAWLLASSHLTASPVEGDMRVLRPVLETIDAGLFLGALATLLLLLRSRWGLVFASMLAATLCGVVRLLLMYSVWGSPWIESWRFDLTVEAVSGAACGLTLLLLAAGGWRVVAAGRAPSANLYLGTQGLSVLSVIYLQLAVRYSGWRLVETPALLLIAGGLTICGYLVLLSVFRALRSRVGFVRSCVALELCAWASLVFTLGRWYWALSFIAAAGLMLSRVLTTLVVARAEQPLAAAVPTTSQA